MKRMIFLLIFILLFSNPLLAMIVELRTHAASSAVWIENGNFMVSLDDSAAFFWDNNSAELLFAYSLGKLSR